MPTYIYKIRPTRADMLLTGPTDTESAVLGEHFEYLSRLTDKGQVYLAGRTQTEDENSFGIVVFCADSDEAAKHLAVNDPAIRDGVMSYEMFPFKIALWSTEGHAE